ncbi:MULTISPECIES: hypothetical protein [unclassified Bacillus (in: firmicutes)]|uniref:hypothetical protein n=1 Tax=unclassified Bacillus (in: firmicutes) TaxID=185979 RepID=UPI0008E36274|nr:MULTISPECIES: hypothetical protein [unclassified Bacillus (in: firmicutes)]SFB19824.1 hypothetical protein SAMN02799634_10836 [Bacillus sp. UNCCL13]SFQ90757.1 hypothetical protein SAMN04488577_3852 [Bacillus sp. cl95]
MPTKISLMKNPDKIIMNPDDVNEVIEAILTKCGFTVVRGTAHSEVDIRARKSDIELIVESRGNQAYKNRGTDIVFDSAQLDIQLSEQVTQIMRFQQTISTNHKTIFVMANPEISRLTERVRKISKGLDKLGILRLWVGDFDQIHIEGPDYIREQLKELL